MARLLAIVAAVVLGSACDPDKGSSEESDADTDTDSDTDTDTDIDGDADGYGADDCDDANADVHPGADEHCDGVDEDCDEDVDEAAVDGTVWYVDADGDGFGGDETVTDCTEPKGYTANSDDCDDEHAEAHPGAAEIWYDAIDGDCLGGNDFDQDGDGSALAVDCADTDKAVHPGVDELCNGIDDDCDDATDEDAIDASIWYADEDGDGYGVEDTTLPSCGEPKGEWAAVAGDCDDADGSRNPGEAEVCADGIDADCDGFDNCRIDATSADATLDGESALDTAGWTVGGAGDMDGDGILDVFAGAPGATSEAGAAYVVLGPLSDGDLSSAVARIEGSAAADRAGTAMAGGADLDDDGTPDLVVGVPGYSPFGLPEGAAAIFFGPVSGDLAVTDADSFFAGEGSSDEAGTDVAAAGDVNDDGVADLLVGAPMDSSGGISSGTVYLIHGPISGTGDLSVADAKIQGDADYQYLSPASGPGDVDGDGIDDVVVAATGDDGGGASAGAVYLLLGPVSTGYTSSMDEATWLGEGDSAYAGAALAPAGDVDGDGNADILVGSYGYDGFRGAAYVVRGDMATGSLAAAYAKLVGHAGGDLAGTSVAGRGDIDDDGVVDVIVGAPGDDTGASAAGAAYLALGPLSGTSDLAGSAQTIIGTTGNELCGWSVAIPGDMDADGIDDVLIGAEGLDEAAGDAGGVYLFFGSSAW
jgi:hypothetical protein